MLFVAKIPRRTFVTSKNICPASNENGAVFWICSWDFNFWRNVFAESRFFEDGFLLTLKW